MSNVLRLAIVDPSDNSRTQLKNTLLGMDIVWLEAECSRYEFFADVIGQTKPDIGVIAIDSNPEKGLKLLEQVREIAPDCALLVISSSTSNEEFSVCRRQLGSAPPGTVMARARSPARSW